jgi:hypothetical protein
MSRHIAEADLALFISGDVNLLKRALVRLHIGGCEACRTRGEAYRQGRQSLKQAAAELPPGLNWESLAAEMTANIRVGLAAGECVAPRLKKPVAFAAWKPAAIVTGIVAVLSAAWWLNLPASDTDSLARSFHNVTQSLVSGGRPSIPVVLDRGPEAQVAMAQQNGVPAPVPEVAVPLSTAVNASSPASSTSPAADNLIVTVAVSGPTPNRIELPDKLSPITLSSYDPGNSKVTSRGGLYLVDFHPVLSLRNSSVKRVRSVALTVVGAETSAGGKASVSVPGLNVAPGETFSVRINQTLASPALDTASIQVQLDGVLFEDLSFYGADKLHLQHSMTAWELEARQDRKYFKSLLEASGREALETAMLESLERQAEVPQSTAQVTPSRATNFGPGQNMQFAFLSLPDTPVELSGGLARVSTNEASGPRFTVRNISQRPVQHVEIGWILKDQDGREFLAASLPASLNLAPGQSSQVSEDAGLRFSGHSAIQSMRGFISSAEFTDGSYWIPSRRELGDPQLRRVVAPSPEEQRLTQLYHTKGLPALIEELRKF